MTTAIGQFGFFLFIGAGLELLYLTSPVHELGHWLAALMIGRHATYGFRSIGMSWAGITEPEVLFIAYSGVVFEVSVFALLAIWLSKKHNLLSGTCFGAALSAYFTTVMLTDMDLVNGVGLGWYYVTGFIALLISFITIAYRIDHSGLYVKTA